jgi:hypothetical protein
MCECIARRRRRRKVAALACDTFAAGQPAGQAGTARTPRQPSRAGKARQAGPASRATQTTGPSRPPLGIWGTRFCRAEIDTAAVPEEWAETGAGATSPS